MPRTPKHSTGNNTCAAGANAVAYALGKESATTALGAHLEHCAVCRQEVALAKETAALLRAAPVQEPTPDLTARIVAALPNAGTAPDWHVWRPLAAAAAALAISTGVWLWQPRPVAQSPSTTWLLQTQNADGLWRPTATISARNPYFPALTALAALALERESAANGAAVERAVAALLQLQQPDGAFDQPGQYVAYNRAMVAAALLGIREKRPELVPAATIERAIVQMRTAQNAIGAWGYTAGDEPNVALTVWYIDALQRANAQGWGDPQGHLRKAIRWLRAQQDREGHFCYDTTPASATHTLDAMGFAILLESRLDAREHQRLARQARAMIKNFSDAPSTDYYRDYFAVRALQASGDTAGAVALRRQLQTAQTAAMPSFSDRWTPVGGQLYAAAVTLLAAR